MQGDSPDRTRQPLPRQAETSGDVMRASGVQLGVLVLIVLLNLLVVWVLWTIFSAG